MSGGYDAVLNYAITGTDNGAKAMFNDVNASIASSAKRVDDLAKSLQNSAGKIDRHSQGLAGGADAAEKFAQGVQSASLRIPQLQEASTVLNSAMAALANPLVLLPSLFAGAAVGAGHLAMANSDLVEHLGNLHAQTGLSISELYNLREIAIPMALDFDTLAKATSKMSTNMGLGGKQIKDLKLSGTDVIENMAQVADQFAKADTQTEKNRIGMAAFGKGFGELAPILEQGGAAIRALRQNVGLDEGSIEKYKALDEVGDQLESSWRAIKFEIGDTAAGPLTSLLEGLKIGVDYLRDTARIWHEIRSYGVNATASDAGLAKQQNALGNLMTTKGVMSATGGIYEAQFLAEYNKLGKAAAQQVLLGWSQETTGGRYGKEFQIKLLGEMQSAWAALPEEAKKTSPVGLTDEEKKKLAEELEFRRQTIASIAEITATGAQKELIAIQNKYATLIEKHKGYSDTVIALKMAEAAEINRLQSKTNFDQTDMAGQRDRDEASMNFERSEQNRRFGSFQGSKHDVTLMRKMQELGLVGANGVGVYDANQMNAEEMQKAIANAMNTPQNNASIAQQEKDLERLKEIYKGLADYVSGDFANAFTREFIEIQRGHENLAQGMKNVFRSFFLDAEQQLLHFASEWLMKMIIMKAESAFLSESGGGSSGSGGGGNDWVGYVQTAATVVSVVASVAAAADGTPSHRGGLTTLSERGEMERVLTPEGGDFFATRGLYAISPGSQVIPAEKVASSSSGLTVHVHQYGGDPVQNAEQMVRVAREVTSQWGDDGFRSRGIYG